MPNNETIEREIEKLAEKYGGQMVMGIDANGKFGFILAECTKVMLAALTEMRGIALKEAAQLVLTSLPDDSRSAQSQAEHHAAAILGRIDK